MTASRTAEKRALLLSFAAFGSFWGAFAALLPDLRRQVGVEDGELGLALGAIAVCALPAMPLAGRLVDRSGAARVVPVTLVGFAVAVTPLGFATSLPGLVLSLALLGAVTGAYDVALNTATAAWERLEGAPLMAAVHGSFSAGVLVGGVLTGLARQAGAGPRLVLPVVAVLLAALAFSQPAYRRVPSMAEGGAGGRRLGTVLLLLGGLVGAAFLVEDGLQSWSALHLERTLGAAPAVGGLGPGLFAGAMAVGRFGAHVLVPVGKEVIAVAVGGSCIAAGALVFAFAPAPGLALAGLVLAGLGSAVLAPILLSAVGARATPGRQGADLAAVTALGYSGFIAGPPLVGLLSGLTSLPTALALLAVLGAALAIGGPTVLRLPVHRPAAAAP
ncbi:MFS transporter [soil metagenome]